MNLSLIKCNVPVRVSHAYWSGTFRICISNGGSSKFCLVHWKPPKPGCHPWKIPWNQASTRWSQGLTVVIWMALLPASTSPTRSYKALSDAQFFQGICKHCRCNENLNASHKSKCCKSASHPFWASFLDSSDSWHHKMAFHLWQFTAAWGIITAL